MCSTVKLYAPVSPHQLAKVINTGWQDFFLCSDEQKYFFPKLHQGFAEMLARQWEAKVYSAGYVVCLDIRCAFINQFPLETVAYEEHLEYRIPSNFLDQFNQSLVSKIQLLSAFEGVVKGIDESDQREPVLRQVVGY